jgi:hypothetical protein
LRRARDVHIPSAAFAPLVHRQICKSARVAMCTISRRKDSYRHANKTSNKARFVTNFNIRGKLRQFSGKSSSSIRTRRLIAGNHSPNLLEKTGKMFEIPANFKWRGLKDGVGKTDTIIIIDPQNRSKKTKIIRKSSYKAVIIVNHHHHQ